ncbi:hypothetical protein BaRGS_00022658 [Batillaria attramentaria]|uniref:Ubiquitin-like domain-containing protein n=1 Tax=Batillaria attramentaria TaxID=370345 RepID=A0ABD0KFU0_9CAEN
MLVYVKNRAFPLKTFLVSAVPSDKVARIRAQLLHILYELGKDDHQFRLRYNGQVLRDAFTLTDYDITDNAVVTMVPMGKSKDALMEIHSVTSSMTSDLRSHGQPANIKYALEKEVKTFDRREKLLGDFKALLYMHCLAVILALLTTRWYAAIWLGLAAALGVWFVPVYSRLGGYVGNTSHIRQLFCVFSGVISTVCLAVSLYFAVFEWIGVSDNGCHDWEFEGTCSHRNVYTAVFFTLHSVLLIVTAILSWILLANFRVEVGDLIENCLVQERDIEQVMAAARNGRVKEKRIAAFDLSAMAASSDDNKFRIVAEGGLEVLSSLAMSRDEVTQEHAVEALAEILTIPTVQDTFVESGGIGTLTAMLHSPSPRAMQEAASALYNIVAESEENKAAVVAEHGLEDLSHAAREGTIACQRTVAGVLLELAFNADVRAQMASSNVPARALVYLCHSNDADTLRFTLQTLELLAIESSELICAQTELLEMLLDFPFRTMDDRLYLLASKILLYFAENAHTCEQLLGQTRVLESLVAMARTHSAVLQKVVVKIVHCMLEVPQLRTRAREEKMDSVLEYVRDHAADRDAWDMADECLQLMTSAHDLSDLPTLSTMEKLNKMKVKDDSFGSRTSMGSEGKGGSGGSTGSSGDVKKGIA